MSLQEFTNFHEIMTSNQNVKVTTLQDQVCELLVTFIYKRKPVKGCGLS